MKIDYKQSGVDIDAGNALVEAIKPLAQATFSPNVIGGIGSFSGAYALPSGYKQPVILGATDGVGTKLRLAIDANKLDGVGIDLVAMCANDLICNFARPLFFLDYYATGKLDVEAAKRVVAGIAKGCEIAGCALIGGETAEMPGMYQKGDFDLAGFAVGVAEKSDLEQGNKVAVGDVLVALPSSGVHSNGFSLVRKIIEANGLDLEQKIGDSALGEILLTPTKIYVKEFLENREFVHALAHITGGGIIENLPRIFPKSKNLGAKISKNALRILPIFEFLSDFVEESEAFRVFNMGVGMIFALSPTDADKIAAKVGGQIIGEVISGSGVEIF